MGSKIFKVILLICLGGIFTACQEEDALADISLEDVYAEEPVFKFIDTAAGIDLRAGVNQFYMSTAYEQMSDEQIKFISRFEKIDACSDDCQEALEFQIYSVSDTYTSGDILSNEALVPGDYTFADAQDLVLGSVLIEYIHSDGTTYRTDLIAQSPESRFQILSIEEYLRNESGDPTKLLELRLSCQLKNTEGEEVLSFSDATATIAIAYPE